MEATLIVAALSFLGTLIGAISGVIISNKLVIYRLEQLENKVSKHNNLIERTYELEKVSAMQSEKIKELFEWK